VTERPAVEVHRDDTRWRYLAEIDGEQAGFIEFFEGGGVVELVHTEVPDAYQGKGVAGTLARFALDDIRARGLKVVPTCPYVRKWLQPHPEYRDLVARTQF
jgi:predicted GNAT family acetyltransferase